MTSSPMAKVRRKKRAVEAERAEIAPEIASLHAAEKAADARREPEAATRQAEEVALHAHVEPEPEPEPLGAELEPEPEAAAHGGWEQRGGEAGAPWWSNYLLVCRVPLL